MCLGALRGGGGSLKVARGAKNPPAPRGPDPQTTDPIRAKIAVPEARLSQLQGPSTPPLSQGELQRAANTQLHYAWQRQLVETLMIFLKTEAPQQGYGQSKVATALGDGTWAALWPTLGMKEGEFPARPQTPQAAPWGLPQVRIARPPGARVQHAAISALRVATAAVATSAGAGFGPMWTPGGWILGARGLDPVHGVLHRLHL